MKRYMTLGFAVVLALSLAVPALGGPSNPIATSALSLVKVNKKAKAAKQAAVAAQETADRAQSAATAAQSSATNATTAAGQASNAAAAAQTTANNALTEAADVSANDLAVEIEFTDSAVDSTSPKSVVLNCAAGKEPISANGTIGQGILPPEEVELDGTSWYLGPVSRAHEESAFAGNWFVSAGGICIRSAG